MRRLERSRTVALFLALVVLHAGAAHGFAFRSPSPLLNPTLAAYLQAGGTLADLCDHDGDVGGVAGGHCAACGAPSPTLEGGRDETWASLHRAGRRSGHPERGRTAAPGAAPHRAHQPRAPPSPIA